MKHVTAVRPTLTRRHAVGETSARSLLLTVLGEFVLPEDEPVWTSTIVEVLDNLGVEEKSARQALARTAADGWLASERVGRSVRWSLTPSGRRLLTEGAERIYAFGTPRPAWDGLWLILYVSVPESKRRLRHKLRTKLTWAGFGSPGPGMWISPLPEREAEALAVVEGLGLGGGAMSFTARFAAVGSQPEMVGRAWDLDAVAAQYAGFVGTFGDLRPATAHDTMLAQSRLVHEWRRFPFLDPRLPAELLPDAWIGDRARELFAELHAEWAPGALRRWRELRRE
ncbi:PaaX family transcriptional regulator C-terminal domain-containing protein [Actinomadura sp. DC4]|uniref:PaaX family transcriptional regulator n=1 Tax=Actinomadura sp. DC4 TaxID=3055069 RepID=UPI0025B0D45A|nr:PaaX family transcriptional regulator C-terminal domain-containing protein [Actinomadura sp. DC4]MDN3351249.1 PaaX family transcriptional regulator C-terminal domain-containing protein [Actinomadura sp. DC4]